MKPGDVVIDMGTGSGILALFAAQAGARRVYAIENDPKNFAALERTFGNSRFADVIDLLRGDARSVVVPEKADVIIGEMVATGLIEELQIPAMNHLLRYGKPGVRVVLAAMEHTADLVSCNDRFYGHRMPVIRYEYPGEKKLSASALSDVVIYRRVDFTRPVVDPQINTEIQFRLRGGGG